MCSFYSLRVCCIISQTNSPQSIDPTDSLHTYHIQSKIKNRGENSCRFRCSHLFVLFLFKKYQLKMRLGLHTRTHTRLFRPLRCNFLTLSLYRYVYTSRVPVHVAKSTPTATPLPTGRYRIAGQKLGRSGTSCVHFITI